MCPLGNGRPVDMTTFPFLLWYFATQSAVPLHVRPGMQRCSRRGLSHRLVPHLIMNPGRVAGLRTIALEAIPKTVPGSALIERLDVEIGEGQDLIHLCPGGQRGVTTGRAPDDASRGHPGVTGATVHRVQILLAHRRPVSEGPRAMQPSRWVWHIRLSEKVICANRTGGAFVDPVPVGQGVVRIPG